MLHFDHILRKLVNEFCDDRLNTLEANGIFLLNLHTFPPKQTNQQNKSCQNKTKKNIYKDHYNIFTPTSHKQIKTQTRLHNKIE